MMELELGKVKIENVEFSGRTYIRNRRLYIDKEELSKYLKEDKNIKEVEVEIARPGESVRIVPILDVVEPRVKITEGSTIFPGILGGVKMAGEGVTHVLDGCAVMTSAKHILHFTEGLVDMSGPGAEYSRFSRLNNVVVLITPVDKLDRHEYEKSARIAGLRAAAYLGKAASDLEPDEKEVFEYDPIIDAVQKYPDLPRVAYVYMLVCQRRIDNSIYGMESQGILPTVISPTEIIDGAIVSWITPAPCHRNTTYHHQRNPVILELLRRHGKELCFLGVILTNEVVTLPGKERASFFVSRIAKMIGAQGVIITEDGAGNPDTDLMLNCRNLERLGIKTVLVTDEVCGQDGGSQGLADVTQEADAVVSTGNLNELVDLPPMERIIGSLETVEYLTGGFHGCLRKDGSLTVETAVMIGSLCELGFERITTRLR